MREKRSRFLGSWRGLVASLALVAVLPLASHAAITEIIDGSGDRAGNPLVGNTGLSVDLSGNVYIAGFISDNLFRITPAGVIVEVLDESVLLEPLRIASGPDGNIYIVTDGKVLRLTPEGATSVIIDATGDGGGNLLSGPTGLATDSSGNVYVAGNLTDNVFRIAPGGGITQILDATGDGAGTVLNGPHGLTTDSSGNLYVAGGNSDNVFRVTPLGTIDVILDASGDGLGHVLDRPFDIAVDASLNVFVIGTDSKNVFRITPAGVITEIIDETGGGPGRELIAPSFLAAGIRGEVYLSGNVQVFEIAPDGGISEIINETGDGMGNTFSCPQILAVDSIGNLYASGCTSSNVFKIGEPLPVPALGLGAQALLAACLATLAAQRISRAGARPQMSGT